ncbi:MULTISPECIES: cortex morphogenetic protein CmpA [Thermoactinomyces]|uniref:Cortex morphogenetic protein CmpA n=1 Tax=Thermoactinomyces daqus TaxID=1329516 RepID=A0A7W1XCK7_9BACL|nr:MULTISPECIES: cortex morphogenetic protein CmpA [Thermoactinomyces]MBA4544143.1 cortex morphogenetic protein CmpA [Thermoactinomyces daqus]MBH8599531.1 cortex morphogenetic protein CmpA [Thermoactinomyces sp. CICC 10523]MBH8605450.1 cortex morphogenetic protein CmpA [Thermoactinomyces sp. CICC 10522]MBH8608956.1 cortex morphogenetic protein CmpA [Thermoactinomyces sp. CICC 10521]
MPQWLYRQLRRAFLEKDRRQIRLLNQCWFQYQTRVCQITCAREVPSSSE